VVPDAAPLPALTARDVFGDLPTDSGSDAAYDKPPLSHYAAQARPGALAAVGAPLANHVTANLQEETRQRCAAVPKEGQALPEGQQRGPGYCGCAEHPQRPARAGNW
jgi:hypothetical protein